MPLNKNRLNRIKNIDDYLNRQTRITRTRLSEIFQVDEKTIRRDIEVLRDEYKAPIESDQNGYFYSDNFNLPLNLALSGKELNQLKIAVKTLNQFRHLEVFKDLSGLLEKIENSVKFKLDDSTNSHIYFEEVPFYEGTELIDLFIEAIEKQLIVEFEYQSFKSEMPSKQLIHPYVIKEHTNRWYVIGFIPEHNSFTAFALERIKQNDNLKLSSNPFIKNQDFDIKKMFQYTYGMTVFHDRIPDKIILEFSPLQAKYFESKPFCQYKIIDRSNNLVRIQTELITNYELVRKIASMGNGVKVISPLMLKNKVVNFHKNALTNYRS